MFLSQLRIENFRALGEGQAGLTLALSPGLTAIVGENDTGNPVHFFGGRSVSRARLVVTVKLERTLGKQPIEQFDVIAWKDRVGWLRNFVRTKAKE